MIVQNTVLDAKRKTSFAFLLNGTLFSNLSLTINFIFSEIIREIIFPHVQDNSYRIRLLLIDFLELPEIRVYRVNHEYEDLYESRDEDK